MKVLLIDNYDSFTYNLYQYLCELGAEVTVVRNDATTVQAIEAALPDRIVISPGPGSPSDAGISVQVVREFSGRVPILGVCLGHQCIGEAFGGEVKGAGEIRHGKLSTVTHDGRGVFAGLPESFRAIRYHSLAVQDDSVPDELDVTARSDSGVIMGVRHKTYAVEGIQFHPESIMTEHGKELLANFLAQPLPPALPSPALRASGDGEGETDDGHGPEKDTVRLVDQAGEAPPLRAQRGEGAGGRG